MGFSANNVRGLILALSSSAFIGTSFIVKKKGLMRAGASGVGASSVSLLIYYIHICRYAFLYYCINGKTAAYECMSVKLGIIFMLGAKLVGALCLINQNFKVVLT